MPRCSVSKFTYGPQSQVISQLSRTLIIRMNVKIAIIIEIALSSPSFSQLATVSKWWSSSRYRTLEWPQMAEHVGYEPSINLHEPSVNHSRKYVGCRSGEEVVIVSGSDSVDPDSDGLRRFTTCIIQGLPVTPSLPVRVSSDSDRHAIRVSSVEGCRVSHVWIEITCQHEDLRAKECTPRVLSWNALMDGEMLGGVVVLMVGWECRYGGWMMMFGWEEEEHTSYAFQSTAHNPWENSPTQQEGECILSPTVFWQNLRYSLHSSRSACDTPLAAPGKSFIPTFFSVELNST